MLVKAISRTPRVISSRLPRRKAAPSLDALRLLVSKDQLEASICRDSFYDFVQRFWSEIITEDPVWNWHIQELCQYLQEAAERVFLGLPKTHDILINIPPGTTKSTICYVMIPAWCWTRMPTCKIISASHTHTLASDLSRKSRDVIQSEKYQRLFPEVEIKSDQNAKDHYESVQGGVRYAAGIDGKFTGFHGHIIIVDDPLDPEMALSEAGLDKANRVVGTTLPTRKVKKRWFMVLIMQRLHQNDPAANMMTDAKSEKGTPLKHINLPAVLESPKVAMRVRPRRLRKKYVDGLLDPVRMPRKSLDRIRSPQKLNEYGFAGQYLQHPVPPGGGMFKTDKIKIEEPSSALRHFTGLCRYWDKAGTEAGGAWTAGVYLGRDADGRYWILHSNRFQHDSGKREALMKQQAGWDVVAIGPKGKGKLITGAEQEPGSGAKESAQSTVRNLAGFRTRVTRPTGTKRDRADPFSQQVNIGNVSMKPGPWNEEYIEEMKFFPDSRFKDQIDATSGAFEILTTKVLKVGAFGRRKRR